MMEREIYIYRCDNCGGEVESDLPKRFSSGECTECEEENNVSIN